MPKKPSRLHLNPLQVGVAVVIVFVTLFMFGYSSRVIKARELQDEVQMWENEVQLAQQQVDHNQDYREYVKTDQYVIERAHRDLGWGFPNEVAVWVIGRDDDPLVAEAPAPVQPAPYWQQWQQRFFGPR
ncbi:MAG: hypothetical protein H6649_11015 [Caldilineae bacterium]|nr:hypothetical protein [Anaerolineae bacterium]MCB0254388.1 hypothetical protein [Anaerolineae bacterium]MCB9154571.1 hypothetical protein [Caldilineae bacterium]